MSSHFVLANYKMKLYRKINTVCIYLKHFMSSSITNFGPITHSSKGLGSSRGGLEVEQWTDNSTLSISVFVLQCITKQIL